MAWNVVRALLSTLALACIARALQLYRRPHTSVLGVRGRVECEPVAALDDRLDELGRAECRTQPGHRRLDGVLVPSCARQRAQQLGPGHHPAGPPRQGAQQRHPGGRYGPQRAVDHDGVPADLDPVAGDGQRTGPAGQFLAQHLYEGAEPEAFGLDRVDAVGLQRQRGDRADADGQYVVVEGGEQFGQQAAVLRPGQQGRGGGRAGEGDRVQAAGDGRVEQPVDGARCPRAASTGTRGRRPRRLPRPAATPRTRAAARRAAGWRYGGPRRPPPAAGRAPRPWIRRRGTTPRSAPGPVSRP